MPVKAFVNQIKYDPKAENHFELIPAEGARYKSFSFPELCKILASSVEQQIIFLGMQDGIRVTVEIEKR